MYLVFAGFPASYAMKGRAKGVQENIRDRQLERLSSKRGEYSVEVKNMALKNPGALTADELEEYAWE